MDEIRIKGLRIFARHGVYEEEKRQGQEFVVNAVLYTDMEKAGDSDDIGDAVDYGRVCGFIDRFMRENRFDLLEALTKRMAETLLLSFPEVKKADLEVEKPNAPVPLRFETISVKVSCGWHRVFIALGSNMGDRLRYLERAVAHLKEDAHFRNIKVSDFLETKPYGGIEQEDFLNGVMEAETLYSPAGLLSRLQKEEALADRKREIHWGPRTLDLDILFYDKLVLDEEHLIIPHPDLKNRDFVLAPMSQLAPYFVHPVYGKSIEELREENKNEHCRQL